MKCWASSALLSGRAISRGRPRETFSESRMPEIGLSGLMSGCVKKTRKRHAVREMKEDPSEPSCRGRLQTAISCFGQKPRW